METKDLNAHLRAATTDLEPRPGFAADVLRGGRRRRTRNRLMIGAVAVATVAIAAAVAVVPLNLADRRPADTPTHEQDGHPLTSSGGDLIEDTQFVRLAATTWEERLPTTLANKDSLLSQPLADPHVAWAGTTPAGATAIVAQQFTLPSTDAVEYGYRGREAVAVGLLISPTGDAALQLVGVQLEGHWARPGSFVLPDDRTVIALALGAPPQGRAMNISPNVHVDEDGVSRRDWSKPLRYADGVWIGELPEGVDPLNVRMIDSRPELDPTDAEERPMGLHHPLLFTSAYLRGELPHMPDRGLMWEPSEHLLGEDTHLRGNPWDRFQEAVRDSGLLEPTSYAPNPDHWLATVGLPDGRTVLISTYQELDNPAYLFRVVIGADDSVAQVTRFAEVDPTAPIPVAVPLPDDNGYVVAVDPDKQFRFRTADDGQWAAPQDGTALVPRDAVAVKADTGDELALK